MGYFTILLPNNIEGEVRWGKVVKRDKPLFHLFKPRKKSDSESKICYLVTLKSAFVKETQYKLYHTKEGHWSQDAAGKVLLDEPIILAIRRAIEDHENT